MDIIFELLPFIIAIILFIVRLLSGNKEKTPQPQPKGTEPQTLEDVFKQIAKQINEAQKTKTAKEEENKDKSLQEQRLERQKAKAKKAALEAQKIQEKLASSFVERGLTDEQRKKDQHFSPYKIQGATKNPFGKLLSQKEALKQAIVLNEILKTKHF